MRTKRIAYVGLFIALAFVFSYIEFLLPINLGIPGAKLGLANLVIIVSMYLLGERDAFLLSMIRIVLVAFTFANMGSMLYSLAGGVLSFLIMWIGKKSKVLSVAGVSVLGGVFHNVGQILMAMFMLGSDSLLYYLPILMITGIVSGVIIGMLGGMVIPRLKRIIKL